MFSPSRDEVRTFFAETHHKYRAREPLSGLEQTALEVILSHPEYHSILEDPQSVAATYSPEQAQLNPFLHLSLHLAVEEQLAIDQPRGICQSFAQLAAKHGSKHEATHDVLECLGETIWQAQRSGQPPDENAYLECVRRKASR